MAWSQIQLMFLYFQHVISFLGIMIILTGVLYAAYQYIWNVYKSATTNQSANINFVRLTLGRVLILGLEFIVAADLIGTTTTPDYYAVGILAIIVAIRTLLSFSLSREMLSLSKE